METILMNTKNSKTNEPHKFARNLSQRLDLRSSNKHVAVHNRSMELFTTKILPPVELNPMCGQTLTVNSSRLSWPGWYSHPGENYILSLFPGWHAAQLLHFLGVFLTFVAGMLLWIVKIKCFFKILFCVKCNHDWKQISGYKKENSKMVCNFYSFILVIHAILV